MSRKFMIVDTKTFEIRMVYERDAPAQDVYWEFPAEQFEHVEVPLSMNTNIIRTSKENGKWLFYEDRDKKMLYQNQVLQTLINETRMKRNWLLQKSDWIVSVPDAPFTEAQKTAWKVYRQKLRDLPKTITKYDQTVIWPTPPK